MSELRTERLLAFARRLQNCANFADLLQAAREEASEVVGYHHVWFYVAELDDPEQIHLVEISGEQSEHVREVANRLSRADHMIRELISHDYPIVIPDARVDPRTDKEVVAKLQNRTLINIPLRLLDKPFGAFGVGTFGDEGCRPPADWQLEYLLGMAAQIVVAAGRIRMLETEARIAKERQDLERLLQAQKLESIGLLAGGIAHDFNNLLTVITVSASSALQQATDRSLADEIRCILGAVSRGEALTRQLLAISRAQELSLRPLDINVRLRQSLRMARRILPETIHFDLVEGRSLPLFEGDSFQIDQVLMNLFVNARDAMPQGGWLRVETQEVMVNETCSETYPWAKPGRYVLVTVADSGVGMPKEAQERVFEPFFTTKGPRVGTGFGLAAAYGIVRQHRGMIHCYSEVGVGTSFRIYFPAIEHVATAVGSQLGRQAHRGEERVLLAEDDELVRAAAIGILERAGYHVTAVADGEAACQAVSRENYDLVLMDVVMPGMSCREVVTKIRSTNPAAKILLSSGYTAGASREALIHQTGLELLSKPYDPERMLRAVRAVLDGVPPQSPASASGELAEGKSV